MNPPYMRLLIAVLLALIFTIIRLPEQLALIRPLWALLLMLYIQVNLPAAFHVSVLCLIGLTLDALCPSVMGQHALALILAAWCISGRARRFKFFSMTQQMGWVLLLSTVYQSTLFLINLILGYPIGPITMLLPICMTTLMWPWARLMLDKRLLVSLRKNTLTD